MTATQRHTNTICFAISLLATLFSTPAFAQYSLVDNAVQTGPNTFRLTKDSLWQNGSAWNTTKIDLTNDFDFYFDLYFGTKDGIGADGITFTIQQEGTGAGAAGQGLGAGGVKPSLSVEYDTFNNTPYDLNSDHIAIQRDGDQNHSTTNNLKPPVQANLNSANIEDGLWHSTRVIWTASSKTLMVYFDCELRQTYTGDIVHDIFKDNANVYYGFTAATGGSHNEQRVRDIHKLPTMRIDTTICAGSSIKMDLSGADTYSWTPNYAITGTSIPNPTLTPTTSTMYIVTISNKCETWKDTINVTVNPKPIVDLGNDISICIGDPAITLDAGNPGSTYKWTTPDASNESTQTITKDLAGFYTAVVTDINGCKNFDLFKLNVNPLPTIATLDQTVCQGQTATFDAGVFKAYKWGNNTTLKTFSTSTAGNYSIQVTDAKGCKNSKSLILNVNPLPLIAMNNQSICNGSSTNFDAGNTGSTYVWSGLGIGTAQTTAASIAGTYTVTVTSVNNCSAAGSAILSLNPLPIIPIKDTSVCIGSSTSFNAGNAGSIFVWSGQGTGNAQSTAAASPGTYTVQVTNTNNCSASGSAILSLKSLPIVAIANQSICSGSSTTFDAGNIGCTYIWSGLGNGTAQSTSATAAGTYTVQVTNTDNCVATSSATLSLKALPIVSIADQSICNGASTTFDAGNAGASYIWSGQGTGTAQSTIASTSGIYTVSVTDINNCTAMGSAQLNITQAMSLNLGNDTAICAGSSVKLSSNLIDPNFTYLWSDNETTSSIQVATSGTYSMVTTDKTSHCIASDDIVLTVILYPLLDLGADIKICQGENVQLDSKITSGTILWSTLETTPSINIDFADTIRVVAFNDILCPVFDTIVSTVVPMPISTLLGDTSLCFLDQPSVSLNAGNTADNYQWENGPNTPILSIDKEGTYNVTISNANFCSITDQVTVKEICPTSVFVPNAFTPFNEDGVNDFFKVKGSNLTNFHLMGFNRWGELLFESFDIDKGWDGSYKGRPVQIDVYVWKLNVEPKYNSDVALPSKLMGTIAVVK